MTKSILKHIALLLNFAFACTSLHASQEGTLPWSTFTIRTSNLSCTNGVTITGTQTKNGISNLKISAFKRDFVLTKAQLTKLGGFTTNGLIVSSEAGYEETGGCTLYLTFQIGFASGPEQTLIIEINKRGDIRISQPNVISTS